MKHLWKCPEVDCGQTQEFEPEDYVEVGVPMCHECECEMEPAERQPQLRVIIHVEGGVVQDIASDEGVYVEVVDMDNIQSGDICELEMEDEGTDGEVDVYLRETLPIIKDYNERNAAGEP